MVDESNRQIETGSRAEHGREARQNVRAGQDREGRSSRPEQSRTEGRTGVGWGQSWADSRKLVTKRKKFACNGIVS